MGNMIAKACQDEGCLRDGEWRAHLVIVHQLLIGLDHLGSTEVDTAQYDVWFVAGFDVCLQWWLAVQLNGEVHHVAAFHQTVGRGVCPSASNIYSHW